jgi:hypothetical protein
MNRHRDDLALVMDSADFRRDSHVRARTPGLAADLENVLVRPTILIHDRRYERRVEAAAGALALQAAKLHALLAEPLTRPLGSMQAPRCFAGDEAVTLIQNKPVGGTSRSTDNRHLPADGRHERERATSRRPDAIGEKARPADHPRHAGPSASMRQAGWVGDYHLYKEQPTPLGADDHLRRAVQPAFAHDGRLGADFLEEAAQPIRGAQRAEDHPRHTAVAGDGRHCAPRDDAHACQVAPSASMHELDPGGDRHYAAHLAPMRDGPRDAEHLRRDLRSPSTPDFRPGDDRHYAARPASMRDGPRHGEHLRHDLPVSQMREAGSGGDRHDSARSASLRDRSHQAREAGIGGDRHHYAAHVTPMCEELPTDDRLRYDEPPASMRDAAVSQDQPDADAGTYHGLRHVREHAHARLDSLEAAAVSSKTAAARPHNAARARSSAAVESALRQSSAERSGKPRSSTGKRRRSEGLTDARNALRRAYAESKLRLPNAPPRSSARSAGVVDGWERLPDRKTKRARSRRKSSRAIWPWAAALAASSMFFAYTLTLTVFPEPRLAQSPQSIGVETAPKVTSSPPAPIDQPEAEKPTAITRPRATGPKAPKPPTRAVARTECREQTPLANYPPNHLR